MPGGQCAHAFARVKYKSLTLKLHGTREVVCQKCPFVYVCIQLIMNTSGNFCRTCGCEFLDKKRKRNITGEFAKIFQAVFNENVSENDALPRAVCDRCKYQIEKAWRQSEEAKEYLSVLKRKHPVSPLSSSCGDEQTVTRIERKKKGQRLVFESSCPKQMPVTAGTCSTKESVPVYILPSLSTPSAPVVSACVSEVSSTLPLVRKMHNVATQTAKSNCQCHPSTKKGTCVKVSSQHDKYEDSICKSF